MLGTRVPRHAKNPRPTSTIAEQCSKIKQRIRITKKGERVIVDPDVTLEYAFDVYYC